MRGITGWPRLTVTRCGSGARSAARGAPAAARAPPGQADDARPVEGTLEDAVKLAKREAIERVLAQAGGNVARAAAKLGILRTSLYRIIKRYGIETAPRAETAPESRPTNQQIERQLED